MREINDNMCSLKMTDVDLNIRRQTCPISIRLFLSTLRWKRLHAIRISTKKMRYSDKPKTQMIIRSICRKKNNSDRNAT